MVQHIRKKHPEFAPLANTIHTPLTTAVISSTPAVISADGTTAEAVVVRKMDNCTYSKWKIKVISSPPAVLTPDYSLHRPQTCWPRLWRSFRRPWPQTIARHREITRESSTFLCHRQQAAACPSHNTFSCRWCRWLRLVSKILSLKATCCFCSTTLPELDLIWKDLSQIFEFACRCDVSFLFQPQERKLQSSY